MLLFFQYVCCGTIDQVFASFQIFVIVFYCVKLSRLSFFLVLLDSCVVSLFFCFVLYPLSHVRSRPPPCQMALVWYLCDTCATLATIGASFWDHWAPFWEHGTQF